MVHAALATWNLQWAGVSTPRGRRVQAELCRHDFDVLIATEATLGVLPPHGYVVDAGTDWGYSVKDPGRRKVVLWSKQPWDDVDAIGDRGLPGGRWVAATTSTPIGLLRVVGVCIPWSGAHVSSGRRDRINWQDHAAYLAHLPSLLRSQPRPTVVAGDFNQRVPRHGQPRDIADALTVSLDGFSLCTAGETEHGRLIDHVATTPDLAASIESFFAKRVDEAPLSDHTGVVVAVTAGA